MKVMIGYDGSPCVEAAIKDLSRAGLPETAELLVVTAVDPYNSSIRVTSEPRTIREMFTELIFAKAVSYSRIRAARSKLKAQKRVREGSLLLRTMFPQWTVRDKILIGETADAILSEAKRWKPDLIVVGSNGRSSIGRFLLGSVSRSLAESAKVPVRIGRLGAETGNQTPNRIVAGSTNLDGIQTLVRTLGLRKWSKDTCLHLNMIDDGVSSGRLSPAYAYAEFIIEETIEPLKEAGLSVNVEITRGDVGPVLLQAAETHHADALFLAVDPAHSAIICPMTANVIEKSNCTIEIVR